MIFKQYNRRYMIFLTINLNKGKKKNELKMNQLDFSAIILKIFKELKI
jgi:hypothetical protein